VPDWGGLSTKCLGHFTPKGKRTVCVGELCEGMRKISLPPGFESQTIRPIVTSYTSYDISALLAHTAEVKNCRSHTSTSLHGVYREKFTNYSICMV
jgi:hypothetical protein